MPFGKHLKRLRLASNTSTQTLADALKINAAKMRKWEQRNSNPQPHDIETIERYFGVTISELQKLKALPELKKTKTGKKLKQMKRVVNEHAQIQSFQITIQLLRHRLLTLEMQLKANRKENNRLMKLLAKKNNIS